MKIKAEKIVMVPLKDIRTNPKNRNKHPQKQIDLMVKVLQYQGFRRPATVSNRSGYLVCGEGRYLAAKQLGAKKIPVMYQDYDDEEQEYADGVADNAIDKQSQLDMAAINFDLKDLGPDFNLEMLGIEDFKLDPSEFGKPQVVDSFQEARQEYDPNTIKQITLVFSADEYNSVVDKFVKIQKDNGLLNNTEVVLHLLNSY